MIRASHVFRQHDCILKRDMGNAHVLELGGTAKRLFDMAIRRHKAVIQNGEDFFKWGKWSRKFQFEIYIC
jgi:hypothetical protein